MGFAPAAVAVAEGRGDPYRTMWWRSPAGVWSTRSVDLPSGIALESVAFVPGVGYVAWGEGELPPMVVDEVISIPTRGARILSSVNGRDWTLWPGDPGLRRAGIGGLAVLDGGSEVFAMNGEFCMRRAIWYLGPDRTWRPERLASRDPTAANDGTVDAAVMFEGRVIMAGSGCDIGQCWIDVWVEQAPAG